MFRKMLHFETALKYLWVQAVQHIFFLPVKIDQKYNNSEA